MVTSKRPWWRLNQSARLSAWLGVGNLIVGLCWLGTGLLGTLRSYWLPFVIAPLCLATGAMYCINAIVQRKRE